MPVRRAMLLLGCFIAACGDDPIEPPDTGEPIVTSSAIELDLDAALASFALEAADPDGPVAITCSGAFAVTGTDQVSAELPFADVRLVPELTTTCLLEQNEAVTAHTVTYTGGWDLDRAPTAEYPRPVEVMRVGTPVPLRVAATDDWSVASYALAWAAGDSEAACDAPTGTIPAVPTAAGTSAVDTVEVSFTTPGLHCIRITAVDDAGQVGVTDSVYMVGTADPPVLDPAAFLDEFTGRQQFEESAVRLSLAFDDVDPIAGVWVMHYSISTASDEGSFTGTYADGVLTLELTVDAGCSGAYTVTGRALDAAGDYWTFDVAPAEACWGYATGPLTVMRQEVPDLP